MEWFRFTLFNCITLFVMALTIAAGARRFYANLRSNWGPAYWAVVLGYTFGFTGGLSVPQVLTGTACALLIRFSPWPLQVRWVECVVMGLVLWRCVGLLLMW